ncbi:MAG: hypothetical protein KDD15_34315, partial [Lewinella sp.]|nr:hypothetical protein [Lewinella sp.]
MKFQLNFILLICCSLLVTSCVSTKKYEAMQASMQEDLDLANEQLGQCGQDLNKYMNMLSSCEQEKTRLQTSLNLREEQINDLRTQVTDFREQRDKQLTQVGDLTVLSQSANENIKETLSQLEKKDKYIRLLQAAKSKADSINLALAVNLKSVLREGI